jgi:hypothetical protein
MLYIIASLLEIYYIPIAFYTYDGKYNRYAKDLI